MKWSFHDASSIAKGAAAALGFAACCLSSGAGAQGAQPNCTNPQFQSEMNACAAIEFKRVDDLLNRKYRDVRTVLRDLDATLPIELRGAEKRLIEGQRGWVAYRQGHCDVVAYDARGGTMEALLVATCAAELTEARIREFDAIIQRKAR
ncbi:MAG: lysozyme inhibitor LprI family protein [Hyphomicrobiaceae bacterium]